jgi:hypothetical protein
MSFGGRVVGGGRRAKEAIVASKAGSERAFFMTDVDERHSLGPIEKRADYHRDDGKVVASTEIAPELTRSQAP